MHTHKHKHTLRPKYIWVRGPFASAICAVYLAKES